MESIHFFRFNYYGLETDDITKVRQTLFMFIDLFGLEKFDYHTLVGEEENLSFHIFNYFSQVRFFITVKKNYRQVAYHNWGHGFHVANSIYCILKQTQGKFSMLEVDILIK